jgi:hypothetical protein
MKYINKSTLKSKMRRAGFRCEVRKEAWRKHWTYCRAHGRFYRVRWKDGAVDISESIDSFDRWANSTERTLAIEDFVQEFLE